MGNPHDVQKKLSRSHCTWKSRMCLEPQVQEEAAEVGTLDDVGPQVQKVTDEVILFI